MQNQYSNIYILVKKVYGVSYYCRLKSIYEPDILFQISADS